MPSHTIFVACKNANGEADMFVCTLDVTESDVDLGNHYDLAEQEAVESGYEGPFVCFDEHEQHNILRVTGDLPKARDVPAMKPEEITTLSKINSEHEDMFSSYSEWKDVGYDLKMARGFVWLQNDAEDHALTLIDDMPYRGTTSLITQRLVDTYC
ncbi:hypothetical protein [Neptuniibacter halophilus]|uniref:hypothetical protein n=1 Tax=Neptuniibacter halophilus TaxID=651666 RepID=UPI002573CCA2|nr:hypothetical protein [Neptuniibacter halophilus]